MYSLSRTLAVRFSLTLLIALVFIGVWAFLGVHSTLRQQLDDSLASALALEMDVIAAGVALAPYRGGADTAAFARGVNRMVVLRDSMGAVVATNTSVARRLPVDAAAFAGARRGERRFVTEPWGDGWVRAVYAPIPPELQASGAVMQIAASTVLLARANRQTLAVVFGTTLLSLVATAFGAAWLARSAVAPVAEIADQAEGIGPGVVGQRITAHADVEELRSLVAVLNRMLERLDAAFAAQQRIIADVGHDLRTPLTSMRGYIEVALRGERDAAAYRRVLTGVLEDIDQLGSLSESLILLARIEAGELAPQLAAVNLADLAADALRRSEPRAGGRRFRLECISEPVVVQADAAMLGLVLDHLLDNAIRHTPPETSVETVVRVNTGAELVVRDDGPGIAETNLVDLFGRFYRGDQARTRTSSAGVAGLGLTIAAAIVDAHGGRITATNVPPSGLEILIRLPLAPAH